MNSPRRRYFCARRAAFAALVTGFVWLSIFSCSSDPPNTLGSDSDLLGSEPGDVYQDTIGVFGDTTYAFDTPIATTADLELGRKDHYERIMILQPGFADVQPGDINRTVQSADLHLFTGNVSGSFPARFYRLGNKYTEGNTVSHLDTLTDADAIPDPGTGSLERAIEPAEQNYSIPPALAQMWVRTDSTREAIAVFYTDTVNRRSTTIPSQDATSDQPYLRVVYTDQIERSYDIRDDATVYRPDTTTTHLIVSDGYARRVYLRMQLDDLAPESSVHTAHLRLHIVPGTLLGTNTSLILYIPDSTDPAEADFKGGQRIEEIIVKTADTFIEFPLKNAIFLILQGTLKDNGFAIRFADENTRLRQVQFYGTDAPDSLKPKVFVTSSTPAVFD